MYKFIYLLAYFLTYLRGLQFQEQFRQKHQILLRN